VDIIRLAISRPVGVAVGVILVVMFGLIGVGQIPLQLTPTVDRPVLTVTTMWPGRSPQEIVDEITKEQEEQLKSVPNLKAMRSTTSEGSVEITLEFIVGADMTLATQEVSDALRQVEEYPEEVTEPAIKSTEGGPETAIAWIIIDVDPEANHPDFDVTTLLHAMDKEVKPYLERIDGVAEVNIYGGREREVRVLLDPETLALRGVNHVQVINALRAQNRNTSAGTIAEGKRDYRVRVVGQYASPAEVLDTIVAYEESGPVYVRDLGRVEVSHERERGFVRSFGQPCLAMNVIRKSGSNVVDIMDDLKLRLEEVRADILPKLHPTAGPDLRLRQVYDETMYIHSAVSLVTQNLWIGGIIAALVLLLFLRSLISTGIIALAIPVSVVGTFLVLLALGRSLNVVSLAGLAFAVGMVVDNAIVVLENIYRRLRMGEAPMEAAEKGGREVWGAVLAATLTTVAVFIPVLTIQEEAGQLFRDISIAVVAAVMLSMAVSILVIPAACSRWLRFHDDEKHGPLRTAFETLFGLAPLLSRCVDWLGDAITWLITGWRGWSLRPAVILLLTVLSLGGAYLLMPPLDYLPAGNRNLVFGVLMAPPGLSVDHREVIAERIEDRVLPYAQADIDDPASMASLDPIQPAFGPGQPFDPVAIQNFFIGAFGDLIFVGATSQEEQVVLPLSSLLTNSMSSINSDYFGFAQQSSLFSRGLQGGSNISLEIAGPRLPEVLRAAQALQDRARAEFGFGVQADPGNFNLQQQETRLVITDRARELGLTSSDIGVAVRGLFDGAFAGDYQLEGDPVDLVVLPLGGRLPSLDELASIPIATPSGHVVPVDDLVNFVQTLAPQSILRIEEQPAVAISITPRQGETIEQTMAAIEEKVVEPVIAQGLIDSTMRWQLEGVAAQLDEVKASLLGGAGNGDDRNAVLAGAMNGGAVISLVVGVVMSGLVLVRGLQRKRMRAGWYGSVGVLLISLLLGMLLLGFGQSPDLLQARLVWALAVTYLLMCALFESFLYPLVIMFTVPLAIVGGFLGLRIVHDLSVMNPVLAPQNLDVLTMLGFVILIGVVVNNAILLVHQSLNNMRGADGSDPMAPFDAIAESVRTRVRPIFMSTLTSVGGMLPLVLFPGPGSEMYRGLGSVVIGGLVASTVFTLVLVPLLLSLVIQMHQSALFLLKRQSEGPESPRIVGERAASVA
jgi:HAE1 family hydrophobic/amphiphilic exporter-1